MASGKVAPKPRAPRPATPKRGRPRGTAKGPAGALRSTRLDVPVSEEERDRIVALAAAHQVSAAQWVRTRSLTTVPVTGSEVATLLERWQWDDTSSEEQVAMAMVVRRLRATL